MVRNYKRKTEDRWSKEDLLEALCCIKDAKLKINDAARHYGISRATLYRQYQKFILAGGKCDANQFRTCGGNPILTKVEEDVLEKTIRDLREQGFTVTSSDIKRICFEYCDSNGIPNQFNQEKRMASDDWYYGFLKRHPAVIIPKPVGASVSGLSTGGTTSSAVPSPLAETSPKQKKKSSPEMPQTKIFAAKSQVHSVAAAVSTVTAVGNNRQLPPTSNLPNRGEKQKQPAAAIIIPTASLKKPLKRLSGKGKKSRSDASSSSRIPVDEDAVKVEYDDEEDKDEEDTGEQDFMETEDTNDDDEEEEEDEEDENDGVMVNEEEEEDEDEDGVEVDDEEEEGNVYVNEGDEDEDVEMVEEEEEQDEAEKESSEEEQEEDEDEEGEGKAEDDDEEAADEQEEGDEENDGGNEDEDGDDGEEMEGNEAEEGEEEAEGEEDDDDDEDD